MPCGEIKRRGSVCNVDVESLTSFLKGKLCTFIAHLIICTGNFFSHMSHVLYESMAIVWQQHYFQIMKLCRARQAFCTEGISNHYYCLHVIELERFVVKGKTT